MQMKMAFRDLEKQYQHLKNEIDSAIQRVCANGTFISGSDVKQLENRLASFVGVKHCISCANGTDALSLVLMAWGIGPGDAIFVPDFTFFATAECVAFCGAVPIYVDVNKETFNMCPKSLKQAIELVQKKGELVPRVIIPVDLFGQPAEYEEIEAISKEHNLLVLEDGAQGFGGSVKGKLACSFGHAATTSFFPAKPLGCYGDGGAVFTDNDELAVLLRSYAVHGKSVADKYENVRVGMNSRLDTIQAAVLGVKLDAFEDYELAQVNKAADFYTDKLSNIVQAPTVLPSFSSSWAQYTIQLKSATQRDKLKNYLSDSGIPSMVYYPRTMCQQTALAGTLKYQPLSCANSKELCSRSLSLPIHPYITRQEQELVTDAIIKYF